MAIGSEWLSILGLVSSHECPFVSSCRRQRESFILEGKQLSDYLRIGRFMIFFFCLLVLYSLSFLSPYCLFWFYNKKIKRKTFLRKKPNVYVEISNLFLMNQLAMNNIKSIYKDLKKIKNKIIYKDLMYSTWKSTQHHVAVWTGGQFGGGRILAYIWLSPFAVRLKSPQDC